MAANLERTEETVEGDDPDIPDPLLPSQQNENEPIMKIPNEVWVLILSQLNQKELVQARTVWKKWRQVIDAHFEFTVIVHDAKADLDRIYELRIRDCLITRLYGDKDIFQFPTLLRRVRFWGPVNVNCFQRIMDQAVAVEEFSLTKFALMQDNLIGERRLNGFSKIKKMELLGYMCKDESRTVAKNSTAIFTYDMPDLEKLTINFHCDILSINQIGASLMEFISRHRKLQNVAASLVPEANHPNEAAAIRVTTVQLPKTVEEALKNVQLSVLRITTATKDLPLWTDLLNSQARLQDFRMQLSEGGLLTVQPTYVIGIPFDMLRQPLLRNANTLTSVELKELRLSPSLAPAPADFIPADASVFRFATNLKKLILYRNTDDFRRFPQYPDQPSMINLRMLPTSIEVLEISRFYCRSDELQFVVDVLENLKTIVLTHTGNLNRLGVHGGIVESIAMKKDIQSMNVTPLNYYCSIENKKFDVVKAKFQMNDGDHLYYDFERFRKGLPQPRPPNVEPTYVARHFDNDRHYTHPRQCITEYRARKSRIAAARASTSSNSRPRRQFPAPATARCPAESLHRFESLVGMFCRNLDFPPLQRCSCDDPFHEDSPNGQCPSENHLSRLFHGLDLHLSRNQRMLQFCSTSHGRPQHRPERQRRWSGNDMLHGTPNRSDVFPDGL